MSLLTFEYRAVDAHGTVFRGRVAASSVADAEERIAIRRLILTSPLKTATAVRVRSFPVGELAVGLRILADLSIAGLPMGKVLAAFEPLASATWREVLPSIAADVREGRSFSVALQQCGRRVPQSIIGVLTAGEHTAGAAESLRNAASVAEASDTLRKSVGAALAYPLTVVSTGGVAVALLVFVVLPRFATILEGTGSEVPASTQWLLWTSQFLAELVAPAAAVLTVAFVAASLLMTSESRLLLIDRVTLSLPAIGSIRRAYCSAQFCRALGALLDGGAPMLRAVRLAAPAAGSPVFGSEVLVASARVQAGEPLSRSLCDSRVIGPTTLRLMAAGESMGRLSALVNQAASIESEAAARATTTLIRLIEPAVIVLMAGLVAFVALALMQAVYAFSPAL